jgi:SAM-dependent methyltransferase
MEAREVIEVPDRQPAPAGVGADGQRAHIRSMWAAVAESWAEHAGYTDARHEENSEMLLDLTMPQPGERVLELACGAGGLGLAAAERVSPGGVVVVSDVVVEMTRVAAARAQRRGLTNVSTRVIDIEQIDQPDDSFDVVLCRDGLQFAPDPGRAVREIRRVLRPGGRVALAVWGPREDNPWLGVVFDAVSAQTGKPVPPPGLPGPFSLSDADELFRLLVDAGLVDVVVRELPLPLRARSADDWWTRTGALAGPLSTLLASLPDGAARALRERAQQMARRYDTPSGLEFPGLAMLGAGRK